MKNGRTIVAEREKPAPESERMRARRKSRVKLGLRWVVVIALAVLTVVLLVRGVLALIDVVRDKVGTDDADGQYVLNAEIVDETDAGITTAMREFVTDLGEDLQELGYDMTRAVLPIGKMREVHIYIDGVDGYIKVRTDRGTGVQAEDINRMVRYMSKRGISGFEYIDVRTDRKAYWK